MKRCSRLRKRENGQSCAEKQSKECARAVAKSIHRRQLSPEVKDRDTGDAAPRLYSASVFGNSDLS